MEIFKGFPTFICSIHSETSFGNQTFNSNRFYAKNKRSMNSKSDYYHKQILMLLNQWQPLDKHLYEVQFIWTSHINTNKIYTHVEKIKFTKNKANKVHTRDFIWLADVNHLIVNVAHYIIKLMGIAQAKNCILNALFLCT